MSILTLHPPAKLNRFLHIVGRRPDGYHLLQTAFRRGALGARLGQAAFRLGDVGAGDLADP